MAAAVVAIENVAGVPVWKAALAADLLMGLGFCGLLAAGCLALKGAASGRAVRGFGHEWMVIARSFLGKGCLLAL